MKYGAAVLQLYLIDRRSPHGELGLKSAQVKPLAVEFLSLPSRGAWIEIVFPDAVKPHPAMSLPSRGAWIEIKRAETGTI